MPISAWLRGLGLGQYEQAFRDNDIDTDVLLTLTEHDLRVLGVASLGHRKRLLAAIATLAESANRQPSPAPPISPPASTTLQAERRQLTVMFVDLVGSTALSAEFDPEDLGELLRAYQNAVAGEIVRFEGHVARFLGDGVLACFGWPRAHEDEAERAIRAGLAVLEAVDRLRTPKGEPVAARIGVATGLVVVGELIGEGAAREEAVLGETPNLAARLQQIATPGALVVAESTRRLVGTLFEFTDLGPAEVKGFVAPVRAFRVTGEGAAEGRFEALRGTGAAAPLVGRDQELALLLDRWRLAKAGEGQVVLLAGEPGIGKSRIVLALRELVRSEGCVSLRYQSSPYHTNSALYPVIEQLARAAGFARDDEGAIKLAKLKALLAGAIADTSDIAPFLGDLLSLPTEGRLALPPLTPQEKKARTFRALLGQLEGLAAQSPVLMVLEDAHWVDPTTLELFDLVVQRLERLPVLLVVTYRPEFRPPWTGHTHVTALTLNRLGRAAAKAIIDRLAAGKRLPKQLIAEMLAKTEGVPLFIEELTKAVLEAGWLRETAEAYVLDGPLPRLAIPTTLQDSLMARLDRLASKQVAQVGAVIGREFSRDILAAVTGMVESRLDEATAQLSDAGLAFVHGVSPEVTYTFKHALVQDAAYQSLLKSRRYQLHARVADVLEVRFPTIAEAEPERLAHHLTEAGLADRAAQWWLRAAEQAWQRTAYREAAAHLSRGIGMIASLPATPERQDLEARLQNMLALVHLTAWGPSAEAEAALARARALSAATGNSEEEFAATFGQWDLVRQRANAPAILRLARELLGTLRPETSKLLVLQAHHAAWTSYWTCGEYEAACRHAEVGVGLYRPEAHHTLAGQFAHHDAGVCCRCTLGIAGQLLGHSEHAKDRTAEALDLAASLNHPQTRITALAYAVCINALRRDAVRVRELAETTAEECQQQGVLKFGAAAKFMLAWAEAALGAGGAARARMAHMLAEMAERRYRLRRSFFLGLQAAACLDANGAAEGLAAVKEALAFAEAYGERWYEPELHRLHGELLLRTSRNGRDEAEAAFLRALGAARAAGARWLELRASASLARVWEEQGKRRKAHDLLAPIYDWFTEGFDTPDLREAQALLDTLR